MWVFLARGFRNIGSWSRNLASKLSIPDKLPFPVLLLRNTGDEASSLLGAPQFLSSVVSKFLSFVISLLGMAINARKWASDRKLPNVFLWWGGTVIGFVIWVIILDAFGLDSSHWLASLPVIPYALVLIRTYFFWLLTFFCVVLALPCFVLIFLFILVLSILMIPFGWQFSLAGASLNITAEATPPGEWRLVQLNTVSGMQHSTHSDPEALDVLKDWFQRVSDPIRPEEDMSGP
jgi:hypothetical protein